MSTGEALAAASADLTEDPEESRCGDSLARACEAEGADDAGLDDLIARAIEHYPVSDALQRPIPLAMRRV